CFSLSSRRLFINDTARKHIRVFDVKPDGGLANGRVWAETTGEGPGAPDGMKIDSAGNVYCCGPGGIHVITPEPACLGVIHVPERTANFAWGDDDDRSFYITAPKPANPIRAGMPMPLSGPPALLGEPATKGAQMYIDEINAKGGVLGRKIELLTRDSKADANED